MNKMTQRTKNNGNNGNRETFGKWLFIIVVAMFTLFIVRFAYIAITKDVQHVNLRSQAEQIYTQRRTILAKRGNIYDQHGSVLATDTSRYTLYAVLDKSQRSADGKPLYVKNKKRTARILAKYIKCLNQKFLRRYLKKGSLTRLNLGVPVQTYQLPRCSRLKQKSYKEKTGCFTGSYAINPVNGKEIPIWISDYVLSSYGTGAIMAVPAHDERDYEFAKKFNIEIIPVLEGGDVSKEAFTGDGVHINSDFLNGLGKQGAIDKMIAWLEEKGIGTKKINYKIREWIFARQRYWANLFQ